MPALKASVCARAAIPAILMGALTLQGCVQVDHRRFAPGEVPVPVGPAARDNRTPLDPSLACFARQLASRQPRGPIIAVGDVRDYTGKVSISEGAAITQGGALMVASALGKLAPAIRLAERFDPVIAERELGYTDRRQLGDGRSHKVGGSGVPVPWLPYFGGTIAASDYFIIGGITELNYNIRSGGAELRIGQTGPKARTYTQSVAIDLRIVDTRSLLVVKTVSLTKQFTGYEVGFNLFRFFGSELFDVNLGAKGQEPLQLGIRTALEEATLRLVGAVTATDPRPCLDSPEWQGLIDTLRHAASAPGKVPAAKAIARKAAGEIAAAANTAAQAVQRPDPARRPTS